MIFFLKKQISVIYLSREKVAIGSVAVSNPPKMFNFNEFLLSENSWSEIVNKIKVIAKNRVRIVTSDSISYIFIQSIPRGQTNERDFIRSKVIQKIPENLLENEWDYKIISDGKYEKLAIVFSPVKSIFSSFIEELLKVGVEIESVEPVEEAIKRDKNPMIGAGLKNDISGPDSKVLNLSLTRQFNFMERLLIFFKIKKIDSINKLEQ